MTTSACTLIQRAHLAHQTVEYLKGRGSYNHLANLGNLYNHIYVYYNRIYVSYNLVHLCDKLFKKKQPLLSKTPVLTKTLC